jgi:chaperone required for assembly of F1-ATPase
MAVSARRTYASAAAMAVEGGFAVVLDDRPLRTPGGNDMVLASKALAQAIVEEWLAQEKTIEFRVMPMTQLTNTMIDRVRDARGRVIAEAVRHAGSDLLCYRAPGPRDLVARQDAEWRPLLDWIAKTHGATLTVTAGVTPVSQPAQAMAALEAAAAGLDDAGLTILATVAAATGSLVLALALVHGRVDPETVCRLAHLDEAWQNETWGEDAEAKRRLNAITEELTAAARFLKLARTRR